MKIAETRFRWINDNARSLYNSYENELREVIRKRAVDLGISMDDGDEQTAFELMKRNRALLMSDEHRAQVWDAWQPIVDGLTKRMSDLRLQYTVPDMTVTTDE